MKYFRKQFGPDWLIFDIGLALDFWYHDIPPRYADRHIRTLIFGMYWDSLDYETHVEGKARGLYIVVFGFIFGIVRVKRSEANE